MDATATKRSHKLVSYLGFLLAIAVACLVLMVFGAVVIQWGN